MQIHQYTEWIFINITWDNWFRLSQYWVGVIQDKIGSNFSIHTTLRLGCHQKLFFICGYLLGLQQSETLFFEMFIVLNYLSTFFFCHLPYRWLHTKGIFCKIFLLAPSSFMALCHLARNTGSSEWPNVLTVSHRELLYETSLTAHKLKAILFTAISRFTDCLQPVTVLATLTGQAPKVLYIFLVVF